MNIDTYAGLSVAHYVAMRNLDTPEIDRIVQKDSKLFERASRVMSRLDFIDEIRYHIPLDLNDGIECAERNALETYLLCTCLDTLAGKDDYVDIQKWLETKKLSIQGITERNKLMTPQVGEQRVLTKNVFSSLLSDIIKLYNEYYGIGRNIKNLINELPVEIKEELTKAYTMYEESKGEKSWQQKDIVAKIKTIFIEYLFQYRRNSYTHESKRFGSFGGVSAVRESLGKGIVETSPASAIRFHPEDNAYIVNCHDGDEAEFLRKVIIACLAHKFELLHNEWSVTYRKAERSKKLLYALLYELKNNIQVMQLHLQVLSEPLVIKIDNGSPKLEIKIAQSILENNNNEITARDGYLLHPYLHPYIEAALQFNNEIDKTGADTKYHMEDTSQFANELIMKSKVRLYAKELGKHCTQLLEDYPVWTYSTDYAPSQR